MFSTFRIISILRCTRRKYGTERKSSTYYEILQVPNDATKKDIRLAFLKLSKKMHPDTSSKGDQASHDDFIKINEAYNVLSKDNSRQEYDSTLLYNNNPNKATFRPSNTTVHCNRDSAWYNLHIRNSGRKHKFSNNEYYRTANHSTKNPYNIVVLCVIIVVFSSMIQAVAFRSGSARRYKRLEEETEKNLKEYNVIRSEAIMLNRNDSIDVLINKLKINRKNEEIDEKR
ncbi:hypothetical protein PV327_006070 [Microctonus hyperodae]|uniref:J domain-containing protein n=1 Tax=Microctonus hyperodae TaxID=165561 RepID=A0AA39G2R2_MICHY|nr:hypothetical protein PV327_006070 [Microctonus hyperodae]